MGSRSIASIPARPAPSGRRVCSRPAPPSWAYPRKRRSGRTSLRTLRAAMPSAAWWTLRRSRSSRSSWPRTRPGRSPASWWRQAAGPGGRYIIEQTKQAEGRGHLRGRSGMGKGRSGETMKLGAFFHPTGNHVAAWLHPDAQIDAGTNFRHYAEITQTAERGKFDLMFVADAVATRDGKIEALSRWPQYMAYFDPLTLLPALAAVTTHVGLCATATTSYNEPYHIARKFASLDLSAPAAPAGGARNRSPNAACGPADRGLGGLL